MSTARGTGRAVPACELLPGHEFELDGRRLRVTGEPATMHTGLGMFDDFQLFSRVPVEAVDETRPAPGAVVLEPLTLVGVLEERP